MKNYQCQRRKCSQYEGIKSQELLSTFNILRKCSVNSSESHHELIKNRIFMADKNRPDGYLFYWKD